MLNGIQRQYKDRGVRVIGISVDDKSTAHQIDGFIKSTRLDYEIWRRATASDMDKLGFQFVIPSTAILDSNGRVVARFVGEITASRLTGPLDRLLRKPAKAR
jgi:hypothetical protein